MKASLALAVTLAVVGSACEENWQSFYITENKGPPDPPECEILTEETAPGLLGGVLDFWVRGGYTLILQVRNALSPRADPGRLIAESNGILVHGAYIDFEGDPACGAGAFPSYENRFSFYLGPGSLGTIAFTGIPSSIGSAMADAFLACPSAVSRNRMTVTLRVQLYGITQGGIDMETQVYDFEVTLCYGCLVGCPPGVDTSPEPGCQCDCNNTEDVEDPPCLLGQDLLLDCRHGPDCW